MPYIYLMAPNGATVHLTSTRADTIRSWFGEWLPKFTGWPGLEDASCTIRCNPIAEQHEEPPADWWCAPISEKEPAPPRRWWFDWTADSRIIGDARRFRATNGTEGLDELHQLHREMVTEAAYLAAGGHSYWQCPAMSSEEIRTRAPHPCLARWRATATTDGGRTIITRASLDAQNARAD